MEKLSRAILSLGSNIEDRLLFLSSAISKIENKIGRVVTKSSIYESEALGFQSDISFYNMCVEIETRLSPFQLLALTQAVEIEIGRTKKTTGLYQSRKIDIDIIFFDAEIVDSETLQIPHKLYKERNFVLIPLLELFTKKENQTETSNVTKLIELSPDKSVVKKI